MMTDRVYNGRISLNVEALQNLRAKHGLSQEPQSRAAYPDRKTPEPYGKPAELRAHPISGQD